MLYVVLVSLKCDKNKYTSLVYLVSTPQACCQRGSESEREREREKAREREGEIERAPKALLFMKDRSDMTLMM